MEPLRDPLRIQHAQSARPAEEKRRQGHVLRAGLGGGTPARVGGGNRAPGPRNCQLRLRPPRRAADDARRIPRRCPPFARSARNRQRPPRGRLPHSAGSAFRRRPLGARRAGRGRLRLRFQRGALQIRPGNARSIRRRKRWPRTLGISPRHHESVRIPASHFGRELLPPDSAHAVAARRGPLEAPIRYAVHDVLPRMGTRPRPAAHQRRLLDDAHASIPQPDENGLGADRLFFQV